MKAAVLPDEDGKGGWHCTYAKAFLNIRYIQHQLGRSRRINIHELHLHHWLLFQRKWSCRQDGVGLSFSRLFMGERSGVHGFVFIIQLEGWFISAMNVAIASGILHYKAGLGSLKLGISTTNVQALF